MNTYLVSFGGSTVAVTYQGPDAVRVLDFLFGSLPPAPHASPHLVLRLDRGDGGTWRLFEDERCLCETSSMPLLAEMLLGTVAHNLVDKSQGGALFHAAAVAWGGRGMLLPGQIAAGKSTLTAWLLRQSFSYLTDEMVFFPEGVECFQAFTRPLNIKEGARGAILRLLSHDDRPDKQNTIWRAPETDLIPPGRLGAARVLGQAPFKLILFPHYRPAAPLHWGQLTKAQAGLRLMECLVNARNLPDHGFAQVARIAKMAPAYHLEYSSFDQLWLLLEQWRAP